MEKEIKDFKALCKHFNIQKEIKENFYENHKYLFDSNCLKSDDQSPEAFQKTIIKKEMVEYEAYLISENINTVLREFETIEKLCGLDAYLALWKLWVEGEAKEDIANEFDLTTRTLERRIQKWGNKYCEYGREENRNI